MELKDYIKLLADKDNKEPIEMPTKLPDDLEKLVNGMKKAQSKGYEVIAEAGASMEETNEAINCVQFTTAHITTVYNSFYDLLNRIKLHNTKLIEEKKS